MRKLFSIVLLASIFVIFTPLLIKAQQVNATEFKYDPTLDGLKQLDEAVQSIQGSNKQLLVFVGGNWCSWCMKLNRFIHENKTIDSLIKADYVVVKINYSKENKNPEALKRLGSPARFGFPVLAIVDERGTLLHIQDSGLLESGDGYDEKKIVSFLRNWTVSAVKGI
ncbi:MAG: thioredoxin family protein [Sphingobacteriia bacterium]|nr:thioredoxin family protein [Sphingobacteriia bacterium]